MEGGKLKSFLVWLWHRKEAFIWLGALLFLGLNNPAHHHYTLCPLDNMGFHYCPGCGLGRSIGFFFRLELESSFMAHPLGIPAAMLLLFRSLRVLTKKQSFELSTI